MFRELAFCCARKNTDPFIDFTAYTRPQEPYVNVPYVRDRMRTLRD